MKENTIDVFDGDILCCPICGQRMKNSIDSITKEISPYLWETTCKHYKNLRLSVG